MTLTKREKNFTVLKKVTNTQEGKNVLYETRNNLPGCDLLYQSLRGGDGKLLISVIKTPAHVNDALISNVQLIRVLDLHSCTLLSGSFICRLRGVCEVFLSSFR